MNRRDLLRLAAVGGVASLIGSGCTRYMQESSEKKRNDIEEADIAQLQTTNSTQQYLERIEKIDKSGPILNAVIEVNPEAISDARKLDEERKATGPRGPLHGIPVLIKDNIDTHDRINTTARSLALAGFFAPRSAFI